MRLVVLIIILMVGPAGVAKAAESGNPQSLRVSPAEQARAAELVQQLGSPRFKQRDQAYRELAQMGRKALQALRAGCVADEEEIRIRSETLLRRAEADELRARVELFLADEQGQYQHDLAGWSRFQLLLGNTPNTRKLYAAMIRNPANHSLLLAMQGAPTELAPGLGGLAGSLGALGLELPPLNRLEEAVQLRRAALYSENMNRLPNGGVRQTAPSIADHAALMFGETFVPHANNPPNHLAFQTLQWLYQPELNSAAQGQSEFQESYRDLVIQWGMTRRDVNTVMSLISLGPQLKFTTLQLQQLISRMMFAENSQPWTKAHALTLLAKNRCPDRLILIKTMFQDESAVVKGGPNNPLPDILVKDVALAMAVLSTGQDLSDYGFELQHTQEVMRYNYTNSRFREDDNTTAEQKRVAAFDRWKSWERTQHATIAGAAAFLPRPQR